MLKKSYKENPKFMENFSFCLISKNFFSSETKRFFIIYNFVFFILPFGIYPEKSNTKDTTCL